MKHAGLLRDALLMSLGVLPLACSSPTSDAASQTQPEPLGEPTCTNPALDALTGLTECDEGYQYRASPKTCAEPQATGGATALSEGGCTEDADCGADSFCLCGVSGGQCAPASCLSDAACDAGYHCAREIGECLQYSRLSCQTALDVCRSRDDCESGLCIAGGEGRVCRTATCGRPFLVQGRPRLAPIVRRDDWLLRPLT